MIGDLQEMSLLDLVQVGCSERQTARLSLRNGERAAAIFLADGSIAHAEAGRLEGKEALFEALRWHEGTFDLAIGVTPPARTINGSWFELLLEGTATIDHERSGRPAPGAVHNDPDLREDTVVVATSPGDVTLLRRLRALKDVTGALVARADGTIVAHDLAEGADTVAALAVFLSEAARSLGEALALGAFDRASLQTRHGRLLVVECPAGPLALVLREQASPDLVRRELGACTG